MRKFNNDLNSYVRISRIHDVPSALEEVRSQELIVDQTVLGYEEFFPSLAAYEQENTKLPKSDKLHYKHIYGQKLEILLPEDLRAEDRETFVRRFVGRLTDQKEEALPFAAFIEKHGRGQYITILLSERHYYPDGTSVKVYCGSDRYKNPTTGRLCKKDVPGAILFKRKGDLLYEKKVNYGKKTQLFMIQQSRFDDFRKYIHGILRTVFESLKIKFETCAFIRRIDRHGANKYQQRNITAINNLILEMEKELDQIYQGLLYTDELTPTNHRKFEQLRNWVDKIFHEREAKAKFVSPRKFRVVLFDYLPFDVIDQNLQVYREEIIERMNKLRCQIFGSPEDWGMV